MASHNDRRDIVFTEKLRQSDDPDDDSDDNEEESDVVENLMVGNSIHVVRRDNTPSPYVRHSHDIRRISMSSDGRDS